MLWVTCALGDLGFGQFGKLGLCIPWVTWTLNNLLLNLIIGKLDVLKNLTRTFMAESISGLFISNNARSKGSQYTVAHRVTG